MLLVWVYYVDGKKMIFDKNKAFQPYSKSEKEEILNLQKKNAELRDQIRVQAAALIQDEKYVFLRDKISEQRVILIDLFLRTNETDPMHEWKKFKEIQADLNVLSSILNSVESMTK